MEGPTPVSALIHAATLVTAGVYLMLRSSPMLEYGPTTLIVCTWVGALTAFFAATSGLLQSDMKRVIAYSTCSQLGYMVMAVGLAQYHVAVFHLVNHAAFKALLFMGAGAVIHGMADQQDLRRLGGLVAFMPFTYAAVLVGSLSLMAVPFLTGFYSKDAVLELAVGTFTTSGAVAYWIGTVSAGLTAFYSFRLLALSFFSIPNAPRRDYMNAHEAPMLIVVPLVFLGVLSIVFGYLASDLFRGAGTDFLAASFHVLPDHVALVDAEFAVSQALKLLPAILSLAGAGVAVYMYLVTPSTLVAAKMSLVGMSVYRFLNGQWRWNALVTGLVIAPSLAVGHVISKVIDRGVIETVGPHGFSTVLPMSARTVASYDTNLVTSYALYVMLGLLSIVGLLYAPLMFTGGASSAPELGLVLVYLTGLTLLPSSRSR